MLTPFFHFGKIVAMNKNTHISWDLDGTLCQFNERVLELTGQLPHVLDAQNRLWTTLEQHQNFFATLRPYEDMVELVRVLHGYGFNQRVITGRPRKDSMPGATDDKIQWVKKHISEISDVIVCLSRDKQKHMKAGVVDILIDDRHSNIHNWRMAGGVAIHHKSFDDTFTQLQTLLNLPK